MNYTNNYRTAGSRLLALACAMALSTPAFAQTEAEQNADDVMLEEVIVTAQKREQAAIDVPMTVNVFSDAQIEKTGALVMADIEHYIPGFEIGDSSTQASITIRGISSTNISSGGDPSVAVFYDEVYIPRAATQMAFSDMARVEVLKGPQGTLYGRNAAAGVVNMVPNQPVDYSEGFIRARLGSYSLYRVEAMGNFVVSDNFYLRGNILSNYQGGYVNNTESSRDPGTARNLTARLSGLWTISDATRMQFSWDHDNTNNIGRAAHGISEWAACPTDPFCGKVSNDAVDAKETRDMNAITAKLLHDHNDRLSSKLIASYRKFNTVNIEDQDGVAEFDRYLTTDNVEDSDILYTELQFNYEGENFFLVFGGNYSREDTYQEIPLGTNTDSSMRAVTAGLADQLGLPFDHLWNSNEMAMLMSYLLQQPISPGDVEATGNYMYDLLDAELPGIPVVGPGYAGLPWTEYYYNTGDFKNYGVYGDIDFQFNDKWSVIFGLRYSWDDKTFTWSAPPNTFNDYRPGTDNLIFTPVPGYEEAHTGVLKASDSWSKLTGRAVVRYQINDAAQTFFTYSTGYKSGGFDSLEPSTSDNPLDPEESTNYEWGLKGDFFNRRLVTEFSAFYMELDGRQRGVYSKPPDQSNATPIVINGDQKFKGVELVLNWLMTDTTQLGFLTTWRKEESAWEPFYNSVGDLVVDAESNTADTDYTLTFDWYPEISKGNLAFRAEYIFYENSILSDPTVVHPEGIKGYGKDRKLLNMRLAWTSDDGHWTVGLWGKNLLDNEYVYGVDNISLASFGTPFVKIEPPRTFGIEVAYNFF
ncbi:MAG: TonB-dependent receptor [Gammaproteobacteria bacterium]|nr:TonB-dependent receptor [Gammaproteobacteria bacterium]